MVKFLQITSTNWQLECQRSARLYLRQIENYLTSLKDKIIIATLKRLKHCKLQGCSFSKRGDSLGFRIIFHCISTLCNDLKYCNYGLLYRPNTQTGRLLAELGCHSHNPPIVGRVVDSHSYVSSDSACLCSFSCEQNMSAIVRATVKAVSKRRLLPTRAALTLVSPWLGRTLL